MFGQWRNDFFYGGNDLIPIAKVVEHDNTATWTTDANHLIDDFSIVRDRCYHIGGHDRIEAVISELHRSCIHTMELDMIKTMGFCFFLGLRQHTFGQINPDDSTMPRVHRKCEASPHPDFENPFVWLHIQISDGRLTPLMKNFSKNLIVEPRVGGVHTFNLVGIHALLQTSHNPSSACH